MISENQKISQRQFGRMVVMDWLAKAALLLPGFAENESGRSFILSLIAGVSLAVAYAWVVGWTARHMEQGMYAYTAERLGGGCAKVLMLFYFCYALMNSVLLVRLFGVVAQVFVLPEMSQSVLMAAVVLGGVYIISGGLEVRARVSEVLFSALLYPLLFLLVCAAFSTESGYLGTGRAEFSMQTAKHGLQTFIAFGGTGIFLFLGPSLNKRENTGRTLVRAAIVTGVSVLALCLASIGSFGESGMRALPWPAITLMSSAVIPGSFFQRWDVVFTGLMLATLFPAVGAGMYYLKFLSEGLMGKGKNRGGGRNIGIGFLVYLFALWCGTYDTAFRVFTVVNGYVCVPILVIFTLTLAIVECAGRRRGMKRVVIVLGLCALLGGCGRRELEDRRFPTVLTAETGNIKAQEEERQAQDSKYIDYGHVKAVILSRETAENGQMLREILSYLENNPVFARNILIYVGDEETLEAAKKKEEDTGIYLEDLAKNQPGDGALELPLKDLLNYLHNGEASIKLPALYTENGKILPGGSIELRQEAASASNVPIPRKTGFKE